jgi:exopolyphosphatase/guanosine-5'-triphosphate,3'-diphosphate pyrophosphatase
VAEVSSDGHLKPLSYDRAITRLGGGYTVLNGIDSESAERAFRALGAFSETIKEAGVAPSHVKAVATSVVRRAVNNAWFLSEVKARSGLDVTVIPGDVEARFALRGVSSVIDTEGRDLLVIDIGGGSTEFILKAGRVAGGEPEKAWSMEMGVVHLTEAYLLSDPPQSSELEAMEAEVAKVIARLSGLMGPELSSRYSGQGGAMLAGTAGTITTLAALDQDLVEYDRDLINNYTLSRGRIQAIYKHLTGLTLAERSAILSLEKGREDLIIPGIAITLEVMERMGFTSIRASDAGLLEGILLG